MLINKCFSKKTLPKRATTQIDFNLISVELHLIKLIRVAYASVSKPIYAYAHPFKAM
jgi:hypothetical protein